MFRDTQEELKRLEAELLAEEEEDTPEECAVEAPEEEEPFFCEDAGDEIPANVRPGDIRNFANHYRAYNTDRVDEDLERFSEDVRSGRRRRSGALVLVLILLAGILCGLLWWFARERGLL